MAAEIEREDGLVLVHSEAGGWDIHAPAASLKGLDLPAEILELLDELNPVADRRIGPDPLRDGLERRKGPWFAWAQDLDGAEVKISNEKRERLHHSPLKYLTPAEEPRG